VQSKEATSTKKKDVKETKGKKQKEGKEEKKSYKGKKAKEEIQQNKQPKAPYPPQHQEKPGLESKMNPKPKFQAPSYKGSNKLQDKVALITGGDSGIGRAVAVLYAREGADIAIVYLAVEESDAKETQKYVEKEGRKCLLLAGDVTSSKFCQEAVQKTVDAFGALDILVNNAAFQQHQTIITDIDDEQFEKTFKTNIFGYFYMAKAALNHLKEGSSIINTGSITGLEGHKELLDYASTKGAIHSFTKSLAKQLVDKKIRVNCVSPGPIWTPLIVTDKEPEEAAKHGKRTPMDRPGQPEECAPAYVFFASDADSSYITGEIMTLLGGDTRAV